MYAVGAQDFAAHPASGLTLFWRRPPDAGERPSDVARRQHSERRLLDDR